MSCRRTRFYALFYCAGLLLSAAPALAAETITYSYDALGRLVGSTASGGPNNGIGTSTCFDNAGNRSQYQTGSGALAACPTPTPSSEPTPPTPPPVPPAAPTAVADTGTGACMVNKNINVVANDTDPGGNTPLSVVSVTGDSNVDASVTTGSTTSVTLNGYLPGTDTLYYVVANSKGATASGVITYTTTGTQQRCTQ